MNKKDALEWEHFPAGRHDVETWKARSGWHLFIIEKWVDCFRVVSHGLCPGLVKWENAETLDEAKKLCQEWREKEE